MARTKRTYEVPEYPTSLPKDAVKDQLLWLAERPDLALRVRPNGHPSWVYEEVLEDGSAVKASARRKVLGSLHEYPTKASAITALNRLFAAEEVVPTVASFLPRLMADKEGQWAKGTMRQMDKAFRLRVLPAFGNHRIDEIEPVDVKRWFDRMQETPAAADYAMAALSVTYDHAAQLGLVLATRNPCRGLAIRRSPKPAYYLGEEGLKRLFDALEALPEKKRDYADLIRLILYTGARRGEFINLRWGHHDGLRLRLPESKTGPKFLFLNAPSVAIIAGRRASSGEVRPEDYVFFPKRRRQSVDNSLHAFWAKLTGKANIQGCRVHDLRHNFATVAVNNGIDLKVIAGLLGHADLTSTSRYAKVREATVRRAAERTEALIMARMNASEGSDPQLGGGA